MKEPHKHTHIEFLLGEELKQVFFDENITPTTTLLQYLRNDFKHKGTKEGCNVGDCGACTIVIAEVKNNALIYKACNACLLFLPQIHGKQIITVEHLAENNILHPVQQAMVNLNASQCGFCTPGFVMSLFCLYKETNEVNKEIILETFAGNLCRCTGYQSILDAAFAAFKNKKPDKFDHAKANTIKQLTSIYIITSTYEAANSIYSCPVTLADATHYKQKFPDCKIISGSTDMSLRVTKNHEHFSQILDLTFVNELDYVAESEHFIHIGSQTNLQDIKQLIHPFYPQFSNLLTYFGSKQIRSKSTLAGNIGSASPIGDSLPFLMAINALVVLKSTHNERELYINQFITGYHQTLLSADEIISEIKIPKPQKTIIVDTYKLSKRKDLDISTVCIAVSLQLSDKNNIEYIDVYYGGMAIQTQRANALCDFLISKHWNETTVNTALPLIETDFTPITDARASAHGRMLIAKNLFLKFWNEHQ